MKTKNIKVLYTNRYSQSLGVRHTGCAPSSIVPKIQMEGRWLEQLGFTIGAPLIVEYEEGSIHIRTLTAEELEEKARKEALTELEQKIIQLAKLTQNVQTRTATPSKVAEPTTKYTTSAPESRKH